MLSLIPISDDNPTRRFPIITVLLIAANVLLFFVEPGFGQSAQANVYFYEHAPVPCQLANDCPQIEVPVAGSPRPLTIPSRGLTSFLGAAIFSTFLHAGFLHIIFNMLFLWIFGNNVEDYLGRVKFTLFYLAGGIIASLAHVAWTLATSGPCSSSDIASCVPSVGASGAVAAVMGAYILLYPRVRVNVLVPIFFFFTFVRLSAVAVLVIWFAYQLFIGVQASSGAVEVAWMAHVGGFVFGLVAILLLGGRPQPPQPAYYQPGWR